MTNWNRIRSKRTVLLGMILLAALFFAFPASAGWKTAGKKGKKITYTDASGEKVTGLVKIAGRTYFFNEQGILQTGWKNTPEGRRYFQEEGKRGRKLGAMAAGGVFQIKKAQYGFDKDGSVLRSTVMKKGYVLNAKGKVKEKLTESQFIKLKGKWYFYKKKKGLLKDQVFKFEGDYYYVDEDGVRQTGWISWNGGDYYFQKDGTAVTGKKKIGGKTYSFGSKGRLKGTRENPGTEETSDDTSDDTEEKTGLPKVLIMCGHGQGDSGAVGCNGKYKESVYTRDFGKRLKKALKNTEAVNVTLFNTKYDMFQQMGPVVNRVGSFSGNGKKKKKLLSSIKKNRKIPKLTEFDYAIEIHFNASAPGGKDPGGNGARKGTGIYINSHKKKEKAKIDSKIISAINGTGLRTWGSGVYKSPKLRNAKVFTEIGVNYSLLETCFIDDRDDMKFYLKNRDKMAAAVAEAIVDFLS